MFKDVIGNTNLTEIDFVESYRCPEMNQASKCVTQPKLNSDALAGFIKLLRN